MKPKKELGQNFLVDQHVISETIKAAEIDKEDVILEVGAGTGALTRPVAERAGKVIAVEIDKDLIPELQKNLKGLGNVEIINVDFLNFLNDQYQYINILKREPFKVVGSIPYQITSPLIHQLLKLKTRPELITIVVQKEVAEKIVAQPPNATYLSNFAGNFGQAKILRIIKPNAFRPQPKVDSALLHITPHPDPLVPDIERFEKFLHRGFAQPRKMLNKRFPKELLQKIGIDPQHRPQTLSFEEWVKLFKAVKEKAR